jgi:hypothetical protein
MQDHPRDEPYDQLDAVRELHTVDLHVGEALGCEQAQDRLTDGVAIERRPDRDANLAHRGHRGTLAGDLDLHDRLPVEARRLSPADRRMLELLEPFSGHRGRVCALLEHAGTVPPAFGPRLPIRSFAAY